MSENWPKPRKGGVTKQMRKARTSPTTRAGLSPELYAALQSIRPLPEVPHVLSGPERQDLERHVQQLREQLHEATQAVIYQEQIVDRVSNDPIFYDRSLFVLESLAQTKARVSQGLAAAEHKLMADNEALSVRLAYDLQTREVEDHRAVFGRLDWPGNPNQAGPPPPRGPTLRSVNVPSPRKWWQPSTSLQARAPRRAPRRAPSPPTALRSPVPESPSLLDQAVIQTPLVQYRKCQHRRLHRLFSPADMATMKLLLKKSCSNVCRQNDNATLTLVPSQNKKPVPIKFNDDEPSPIAHIKPNQRKSKADSKDTSNPTQNSEIGVKVVDLASDDEVVAEGDKEWPVQVDGLDEEHILNLSTEPEDGGNSTDVSQPEMEPDSSLWDSTPPGWERVRSPYRGPSPNLDTPKLKTPPDVWGNPGCKCFNNFRLGYCFCPEPMSPTTTLISFGCTDFTDSQMANALATTDEESESNNNDISKEK